MYAWRKTSEDFVPCLKELCLIVSKNLNLRLALNEESLVHEDIKQLFFMFLHLLLKLCMKR